MIEMSHGVFRLEIGVSKSTAIVIEVTVLCTGAMASSPLNSRKVRNLLREFSEKSSPFVETEFMPVRRGESRSVDG